MPFIYALFAGTRRTQMRLFDIDNSIINALDRAEPNEQGEFTSEELDGLLLEREAKLENIGLYIKELEYTAKALQDEEKTLSERKKRAEKKADWLKQYAAASVAQFGIVETSRIKMTIRTSECVEIIDQSQIPEDFLKSKTTWTPDKTAIKDAIKKGEIIDGATLITKANLQIK